MAFLTKTLDVCSGGMDSIWLKSETIGRFEVQEGMFLLESESIFLGFSGRIEWAGPLASVSETLASGPKLRRHKYLSCQEEQYSHVTFE